MEVVTLSPEILKRVLGDLELRYLTDQDGDFLVRFGPSDSRPFSVDCWLIRSGTQNTILGLRGWCDRRFERDRWGECLLVCNTWNHEQRWPKAVVYFDEDENQARISLELDFDLEFGVPYDTLSEFINVFLSTSTSFWRWAVAEQHL